MIEGKSVLGIIPARGGSKRLPRKNIRDLAGKPLIAWTIQAGLNSKYIDELIVSTDDPEIYNISQQYGVKLPFIRPAELASDQASGFAVVEHTLNFYRDNYNKTFDYVLLLQPTSPLRNYSDIDGAFKLLEKENANAIISVCEMEHSPLWANTLPNDLSMANFLAEGVKGKRSQDLDKYYRLNGAIYICDTKRLQQEKTFFIKDNIFAYIMPTERSIDIDTEWDMKLCEAQLLGVQTTDG
ncbi:MAG: CMP-N-acetlyneuraminic acid synthetase [Desulfosporosinus sp. BRH_c37]|nr:MAG: CMP-N-acetlyneuraminic acid synthetase [Desulfosporosinus sp. BRH_c37]